MNRLVYFCAGVRIETLPAIRVRNLLFNVMDNAESEKAINNTRTILKCAEAENYMLDSGGYQIHVAEEQNKKMTFDPSLAMMRSEERINISPLHVVEAACKLQPTIMTALDFPVRCSQTGQIRNRNSLGNWDST